MANLDTTFINRFLFASQNTEYVVAGPMLVFWDRPIVELNLNSEMGWIASEQLSDFL